MRSLTTTLLSALLLALTGSAQNTTLPIFMLDTDPQPLVASIVSANAATTTLWVGCPPGEDASNCGLGPGITVEHISSSIWAASMTPEGEQFSYSWGCTVNGTASTSALCVTSAGGASANDPGMTTTTLSGSDVAVVMVTVTAGGEKLVSATATTASSSGAKATGGSTSSGAAASATKNAAAVGFEKITVAGGIALAGGVVGVLAL
jgi:hypothetical protein